MELIKFFPGGRIQGNYIVCGDIYGNHGKSFKYNLENDLWCDFSTGDSGKGINKLLKLRGEEPPAEHRSSFHPKKPIRKVSINKEALLPSDGPCKKPKQEFRMSPRPGGKYIKHWEYRNQKGDVCFYVVRYKYKEGKETIPYSFNGSSWIPKAWVNDRPLYNVDKIKNYHKVMIVEGEKCADAVEKAFPDYLGMCWQGGCNTVNKSDWSLIKNKTVVIFPDNDNAGYNAAKEVAGILKNKNSVRVMPIHIFDLDEGFDIADMVEQNFDFNALRKRLSI